MPALQTTEPSSHSSTLRPRPRRSPHARSSTGFTLIETLVTMAIAAVLSSVAYPSFEGQLHKVRRSDAVVSMMLVQMAEERWRANRHSYGELAEIGVPSRSTAGHYTLQLSSATETGYEVVAIATGAQARDATCRHMKLSMVGANPVHASGADASLANPDAVNRKCWML